jgi:hypothetical protein
VLWYNGMGWQTNNPSNVLWAALLEKAYAELAQSGWSRGSGAANAYSSLAFGWEGNVINQIANRAVSAAAVTNTSATLNAIVSEFKAGQMVGLDSAPKNTTAGIIADHVYVVVGYNPTTEVFDLYNIWGYHQEVSWATIAANFVSFSFTL